MLNTRRTELERNEAELGGQEQEGKAAEEAERRARQKLEALARGMTTDDEGRPITLDTHLTTTRTQLMQVETNVKRSQMKLLIYFVPHSKKADT